MKKQSKKIGFAILVLCCVCFLMFKFGGNFYSESNYTEVKPIAVHENGRYFSGSKVCAECHSDIHKSHIETAHFNTSAIANFENIKGSFEDPDNIFHLNEKHNFRMENRNGIPYQDIFSKKKNSLLDSLRFDVVIGSGTKGQSYLNWKKNSLYQLQISYFTPNNSWINSPGYLNVLASDRPVFQRCLECHMTYAKGTRNFNRTISYDRKQIMYGVDCERCHGPALDHVNAHRKNPKDSIAMNILKYGDLNRQQKLDACALCHSGLRQQSNNNAFSFVVGDTLTRFSSSGYSEVNSKKLDVHGNQYGLLTASQCFKKSDVMDCTTCHNPHKKERNEHNSFNKKCMDCHNVKKESPIICTESKEKKDVLGNNCIQCHMPLMSSKVMRIQSSKDTFKSVKVRSHFIGIYSDSLQLSN